MTKKTVLFVTYGNGHAEMVTPVVHALAGDKNINVVSLALTIGANVFANAGLPYLGFKDFLDGNDALAHRWGEKLAVEFHSPASGIAREESVAYLGLCYQDLIARHGEAGAAKLWEEKKRHAFLPITVMERVMDRIQPDLVVTTNSPRSEQAAIEVANARGIPNISMADLFGIHHFHPLQSQYVTVLCEGTIDNMKQEGVSLPRERFLVTGNPAFDAAFDWRGDIDYGWRKQYFPDIRDAAKMLLWLDIPSYWDLEKRQTHVRSEAEILRDLNTLADAVKENNGYLLLRPLPAGSMPIYKDWLKEAPSHVRYAGDLPLYPLLKNCDVAATTTSIAGVEALLVERPLIQLKYHSGRSDMPFGEWGMAWQAEGPEDLCECVNRAFYDEEAWQRKLSCIRHILPQEKAGPKVATHIRGILGG